MRTATTVLFAFSLSSLTGHSEAPHHQSFPPGPFSTVNVDDAASSRTRASAVATDRAVPTDGAAGLEMLKGLTGEWQSKTSGGVMTNIFRPIAFGTAVLHEEWLSGKQLTATVFYLVGGELRADHFCDLENQPRYAARPSAEPKVIRFELLDALNLDNHPRHFHSTTWTFEDSTHLTQDWQIVENGQEVRVVRMKFTRAK